MPRDYEGYLDDILASISKIKRYIADFPDGNFDDDEKTFDAVLRNLDVIGEAVKGIPETIRINYPKISTSRNAIQARHSNGFTSGVGATVSVPACFLPGQSGAREPFTSPNATPACVPPPSSDAWVFGRRVKGLKKRGLVMY